MRIHFKPAPRPETILEKDWNNWAWQLRNSLKTLADFTQHFELSSEEKAAFVQGHELFNVRTTPYYAGLAKSGSQEIRRILMPHKKEIEWGAQAMLDPLGEKRNSPAPRIIHRYSDRALFLVTDICSVYCRFCTRKHFTGQEQAFIRQDEYEQALSYLKRATGLREVILSGGDPLTLGDAQLERVLFDLRKIDHIEIIRIGSRMPVVCPMRVSEDLVKIIRQAKPVFLMSHFNHPDELTAEAAVALEKFVDNGIPVMNQMVLLNGVNNHPALVQALSRRLLYLRTKPYYMFQCDPSIGTDHLRTTVEDSLEIQKELWGHLSGLAMPNLALDIPDGAGKTYLVPNHQISQQGVVREFIGWDGVSSQYISPPAEQTLKPDVSAYLNEWEELKNAKKI